MLVSYTVFHGCKLMNLQFGQGKVKNDEQP